MAKLIAVIVSKNSVEPFAITESLQRAAKALGQTIEIETKGKFGNQNSFDEESYKNAGAIILIAPIEEKKRFQNLDNVLITEVNEVVENAVDVLRRAMRLAGAREQDRAGIAKASVRIAAITSCPTGIAHTFMAAEGLSQGAKDLGYLIKVETQGSVGAQHKLTAEEIKAADVVIIAADTQVDKIRFAGKRVFELGTKEAIKDGAGVIRAALSNAQLQAAAKQTPTIEAGAAAYKHLMTGVSFMLPFVVAGGLLIALSFAFGGIYAYDDSQKGSIAWVLFQIGSKGAFSLMVPALAGYIAYSIADRPGLAPGMIGGMLAVHTGAGFLGGMLAGFIAGYTVDFLVKKIRLPTSLQGLKPVLILPLLSSLIVGLIMMYVIGAPLAFLMSALETGLKGMQSTSAALLGAVIGAMMAFDMGGPLNKAAYSFSTGLIGSQIYTPIAAAMAAGMTPPLGIALATRLFKNRFTKEERETGKATGLLGLSFITEGAIPFAAKDPLRILPATMIGSAVAGAISMGANVQLKAPHGGIFVLLIPKAVEGLGMYAVALLTGTFVTAGLIGLLKKKDQSN